MNTIQINPIPYRQGQGTQIYIRPISIELGGETCSTYWQIFDENNKELESGNTEIPSEIYLNWGEDDSIISDYVINKLNLQKL